MDRAGVRIRVRLRIRVRVKVRVSVNNNNSGVGELTDKYSFLEYCFQIIPVIVSIVIIVMNILF